MLTPVIFVYNGTSLQIDLPATSDAELKSVNSPSELPDASIVLFITDKAEDISRHRDMDRKTYFVYVGDEDLSGISSMKDDVLDILRGKPLQEDLPIYVNQ